MTAAVRLNIHPRLKNMTMTTAKKPTKKPARRPTLASIVKFLRTIPYWDVRESTRVMREDIRTAAGWYDRNN